MFVYQSDIKNVAEEYNWLKNETQKTKEVIESKGFPCVFGVQGHN
ncbi:YqcI/YcgG family protein, partial [Staphylococcus epidermidis]|nr:YqcI/YcgG family protein [Staphylococcus epidermidis]